MRHFSFFAGLTLAVALSAAAYTSGLVSDSAPQACLTIGSTTYRLAGGNADVAVRIDPSAAVPALRISLVDSPQEADFVVVDDGAPPACRAASNTRDVSIVPAGMPALVVGLADGAAPADYRIYVRSRWIAPETAAALFAAAHIPAQRVADRADRSN